MDENKCNNWNYKGSLTSQMANMSSNRGTLPVGSLSECVSSYGVYDMAGNVWEWVSDWYDENYYKNSPEKNPKGPNNGKYRGFRGGSWVSSYLFVFRGASRLSYVPTYRNNYGGGFRCAQ